MTEIQIRNVHRTFGTVRAVDGVDLTVGEGEFFTLLGPSGCGKTTLLRMIAGFCELDEGEIRFGDKRIDKLSAHRRDIGMVFQNYAVFPNLSVAGNVAYGLKARAVMIGLGSDLIDIRRIEQAIERHGERFLDRIFTPVERARSEARANRIESYAKRFAAKEACSKALGTGFRRGVFHKDMGVINLKGGKPTMELTGGAKERLAAITPPGMSAQIDISLTDEYPMAEAVVIISAVPTLQA